MGMMVGIPLRSKQDIEIMRNDLITLIVKTIEFSGLVQYFKNNAQTNINSPSDYGVLGRIISELIDSKLHNVSVISFNYDLLLDVQLKSSEIPFDYCLDGEKSTSKLPLLKLHGSINWARNLKTKSIDPIDVFSYDPKERYVPANNMSLPWLIGSNIINKVYRDLTGPPILIPPTWNKTEYQKQLVDVWKVAMDKLSTAENIIFIGYSLPESDLFFKYLYSIGSFSQNIINKVFVINPDPAAIERLKNMLGRDIVDHKLIIYETGTSEGYDYLSRDVINLINP